MRALLRSVFLSRLRLSGWVVAAFFFTAFLSTPAYAVRPVINSGYKLTKAPLQRGSDLTRFEKRQNRIPRGPSGPSVRNNPVQYYRLKPWTWGTLRQR